LYPGLMRAFKEPEYNIEAQMEIKETRISIERFQKIIKRENYTVLKNTFWLINPNYEVKFGMKPRKMPVIFTRIPYLRNFIITTCYYVLRKS
ncbi:MAG: class I SAM-dependent methyltransferase, partial [Bacteroidales bacterium]